MNIVGADHTNWRVRDLERSLPFYRDVLGLEPFGLEEHDRGERPIVSLRVPRRSSSTSDPTPPSSPGPRGAMTTWPW